MPRPPKEKPNHGKYYEVKKTIGKNIDGSLIRKSFYSQISKADAKRQADAYIVNTKVSEQTGIAYVDKTKNFGAWADTWLKSITGVKDSTYEFTYRNSVENHIKPHFGKADITSISNLDVQAFISKKAEKLSKESLKKMKSCLSGIFESAIDNGLCTRNPCRNVKIADDKTDGEDDEDTSKQTYTQDQREKVLEFAKTHRFGFEIEVLLRLGLRRGELLGLRWADVDEANKCVHIRKAAADVKNRKTGAMEVLVSKPKNKYSVRDIPLPDDMITKFQNKPKTIIIGANQHKKKPGINIETTYVFHNSKGEVQSPRTWSRRHYEEFMKDMHDYYLKKEIDVPILNPHELRHTCATLWVNSDANLFSVAVALGHGDLKMLRERYAHPNLDSMRNTLKI